MKRKIVWLVLNCMMVSALVLTSCGGEEEEMTVPTEEVTVPTEEVTVPTEEVTVPTEGEVKWWDKLNITPGLGGVVKYWEKDENFVPEYGGTFTIRAKSSPSHFDPYCGRPSDESRFNCGFVCMPNWTNTPPETWDFKDTFTPMGCHGPLLAESWEIENYQTITFHIRKGVYWQDKYPMNGREFTAYDVEYSWHRLFGLGSGYTEPSPYVNTKLYGPPTSITATDKYTVVYKLPQPSIFNVWTILAHYHYPAILPKEAIELWGDVDDWEHVVGVGPFILESFIEGTSLSYIRNPNYWGYDENYPENRLPYVDKLKALIIPDDSTAFAALRTGKIDVLERVSWDRLASLLDTNPELEVQPFEGNTETIGMPLDRKPYSDIRVRKALQMSLDLKTITDTYYGGIWDGTPLGQIKYKGWRAEYADWPQEVKDEYAYNPEGAKKLLAEAGYPDGFKCTIATPSTKDLDILQIIQAYFKDIGVDMEIEVFEPTVYNSYIEAGKAEMVFSLLNAWAGAFPVSRIANLISSHPSMAYLHINDPVMDEMYEKMSSSLDLEEMRQLVIEADMYAISQHLELTVQPIYNYTLVQPWVKRHAPTHSALNETMKYARLWIDQDIKKALGY